MDLPPGEGALAADAILYLKKGDVPVIAGAFRDAEGCESREIEIQVR